MQDELDFALEIFKVSYTKKKFDGPCACLARICPHFVFNPSFFRHSLALRALDHIVESPRLTDEAKLAALPTITLEFVHKTFQRFVRDAFVTTFACGSVTAELSASFCRQDFISLRHFVALCAHTPAAC